MRLINVEAFLKFDEGTAAPGAQLLVEFNGSELVQEAYAILSHCWGKPEVEVQYKEMQNLTKMDVAARAEIRERSGYHKIRQSCMQAQLNHLRWLWVDTCCIDKRSSAELSEAINSMYVWYANSDCCYAFLHDVDTDALPTEPNRNVFEFNGWPKWFSRGWTLQELIAPEYVHFFNRKWKYITSKQDSARSISAITRVSVDVLLKGLSESYPSVAQIMAWAADRTTTREEDRAYSLLGLFGVHMPMVYGEGKHAFLRLQLEVIRMIDDQSIFAWGWTRQTGSASGFLANDPSHFRDCSDVVRIAPSTIHEYYPTDKIPGLISAEEQFQTFSVTNRGIQIWLPLKRQCRDGDSEFFSATLACCVAGGTASSPITITMEQFGPGPVRHFGPLPVVENQTVTVEYKPVLLPYRTSFNLNIRGPSSKRSRLQVSLDAIMPSDSVIAVLGTSGSGKSNFINKLIGLPPEPRAGLPSVCTTTFSAFVIVLEAKRFAFIDTPALDQIGFEAISRQFRLLYWRSIRFSGVIYTFNLNSNWVGEEVRNLQTVLNMCGEEAIDRLRLVSTMWHAVELGCGTKVQEELEKLVGKVPKTGARCEKFDNTSASAWAIVKGLGDERKVLSIQKMVDDTVNPLKMSGHEWIADLLSM